MRVSWISPGDPMESQRPLHEVDTRGRVTEEDMTVEAEVKVMPLLEGCSQLKNPVIP
jgi:hypothetical protein